MTLETVVFPSMTTGLGERRGYDFAAAAAPLESDGGAPAEDRRRKRRRAKTSKNQEDLESQRMTHITVERNRRKQMNQYFTILRSLMPQSYIQRGDQASIISGAINFVKELEHLLHFLEARRSSGDGGAASTFAKFFTFPQYSASPSGGAAAEIEVTMVESHASLKILSQRKPRHLLNTVAGLQSLGLTILHLNVTSHEQMDLLSFSLKVEEECELSTVDAIAAAVNELLAGL